MEAGFPRFGRNEPVPGSGVPKVADVSNVSEVSGFDGFPRVPGFRRLCSRGSESFPWFRRFQGFGISMGTSGVPEFWFRGFGSLQPDWQKKIHQRRPQTV